MGGSAVRQLGKLVRTLPTGVNKGTVFFLHGTCDSGSGLKSWTEKVLNQEFKFKTYEVKYPSAPDRPYSLLNGQQTPVWFNRHSPSPHMPEDIASINEMGEQLNELIKTEQSYKSKVVVGGFSTGGTMAMHLGYRFNRNINGVFALSSFLNQESEVYKSLEDLEKEFPRPANPDDCSANVIQNGKIEHPPKPKTRILPKLFMTHGTEDPLVHAKWSQKTFDTLRSYGTDGHHHTIRNQSHEITKTQLLLLHTWIEDILSDDTKPTGGSTHKPYHINDEHAVPLFF